MLRTRLLTAAAAAALFAAPAAFAQTPQEPAPAPQPAPQSSPAETSAQTPAAEGNVIEVLRAQGNYSTLLGALDQAQLTDTLATRTVTIFAPTDDAFAALPEAERTRLLDPANANELRQVLLYHVIVADVQRGQIEGARGAVRTAADTEVQLDGTGDQLKIDGATIASTDLDASNGAVFSIDQVLIPSNSQVAAGDAEAEAVTTEAPVADEVAPPPAEAATTPPVDETVTPDTAEPTPPTAPVEEETPAQDDPGA